MLECTIDEEKQLRKEMERMPREYAKETKKALNKAATQVRRIGIDKTFRRYSIKKNEISKSAKKQTAKNSNLQAKITVTGYRTPIYKMKLNDYQTTAQKRESGDVTVKVSVLKNSSLKQIPDRAGRSKPFIAVFSSGHMGVLRTLKGKKTSSGKSKLEEIFTVSPSEMFGRKETMEKMSDTADHIMAVAYRNMLNGGCFK